MILTVLKILPFPIFYLIGAFPTGFLLAKLNGIDIRQKGSGNVGATNVARALGKRAGIYTLLGDICKGLLAISLANFISDGSQNYMALAAFTCVLGHCLSLPPFLRGGKGIATSFGVLSGLNIWLGLSILLCFIVVFAVTRIVSLASVSAAMITSLVAFALNFETSAWYAVTCLALVVIYRHKENLERLSQGKEKKFSFGSDQ